MKHNTQSMVLIGACLLCILSCKRDILMHPDMGYNYFPDRNGHWVSYNVDSIRYDDFTDSVYYYSYQIKEVIESHYTDNEGRQTQRIERYFRNNASQDWQIRSVWAANITPKTAERVEDNYRFIKLAFAVRENRKWDGNAYNILDRRIYEITEADMPYTIGGFAFDSTLTVIQNDEVNYILKDFAEEKYARNVGMIFKNLILHNKIDQAIVSGFEVTYRISDYSR